jgi:hypothetical protein
MCDCTAWAERNSLETVILDSQEYLALDDTSGVISSNNANYVDEKITAKCQKTCPRAHSWKS